MLLFVIMVTTANTIKVRASKCYVADSIINEDSDKYLLWKVAGQRYRPSFGFPSSRAFQTEWMVFVMRYRGKSVLQFAHKRYEKCQFLTQQPGEKYLSLTEPINCGSDVISTRTMFTTNAGPIRSRRYISFFLTPDKMIGHMKRNLILTSRSDEHHLSFWRINLNDKKTCDF